MSRSVSSGRHRCYAQSDENQRDIVFFADEGSALVIIRGAKKEFHFVVGNFQHITFGHAVLDFRAGILQMMEN